MYEKKAKVAIVIMVYAVIYRAIIMFTGTVEKDVVEEIAKLGVSDYLVKPFEIDILLEKVDPFLKEE